MHIDKDSAAYRLGFTDGFEIGVYNQDTHDVLRESNFPINASLYKAGYDAGIAAYSATLGDDA